MNSSAQIHASPSPSRVGKLPDHGVSALFSWRATLASLAHLVTLSPRHLVTSSPPHLVIALALLALSTAAHAGAPSDLAQLDFFEKKIRPVLVENCYECHSDD